MKDLLKQFDYVGKKYGFLITEVTNCSFNIRNTDTNTFIATVTNVDGQLSLRMSHVELDLSKKMYEDIWKLVEEVEEAFYDYGNKGFLMITKTNKKNERVHLITKNIIIPCTVVVLLFLNFFIWKSKDINTLLMGANMMHLLHILIHLSKNKDIFENECSDCN